jgi:hypothetical protein
MADQRSSYAEVAATIDKDNDTTKPTRLSLAITLPTWYLMLLVASCLSVILCIFSAPEKNYSSSIYGPDWVPASKAAIVLNVILCGAFGLAKPTVVNPDCVWTYSVLIAAAFCSFFGQAITVSTDATLGNTVGMVGLVFFAFFWTLVAVWVAAVVGAAILEKSRRASKESPTEQLLEKSIMTSTSTGARSARLYPLVLLSITSVVSWWGAWQLLQARNEIRDNALPFVSSAYASSQSTTDEGGGPGLLLNKTRSETSSSQQLSVHAYSGYVVVQSYEIQNQGNFDASSFVCSNKYSKEQVEASIQVQLNTAWGGSWACPSAGGDTSCATPVLIDFKCHDCFTRSVSLLANCVEERFTPYNPNDDEDADDYVDFANFDPTTSEPDFYAIDGMYFIYGNCATCEAHTSGWMRQQEEKLELAHHGTFLLLGMAVAFTVSLAVVSLLSLEAQAVSFDESSLGTMT